MQKFTGVPCDEQSILKNAILPFGRKLWTFQAQEHLMTFTICDLTEFTCTNGDCLPKSVRCNNTIECEDASDEEACTPVVKKQGYQMRTVPPPRNNESMLTMDIYGWIIKIGNISPNDKNLILEAVLYYEWYDPRLMFWNPVINQTLDCNEIWIPRVSMLDGAEDYGFQVEYKDVLSECGVQTSRINKSELKQSFTDSHMGKH